MFVFLYNVFIWLYGIMIRIASLWNPKARQWVRGRRNIFTRLGQLNDDHCDTVWMHCSSLGEFEQGRPLLEKIKSQYPKLRLVLTFFSPSGYEVIKNYSGVHHICYLPLGFRSSSSRFIELVKPKLVLWIKYDYWFYYLDELKRRNIPVLLVAGIFRKDQPFFKWYGGLHRRMLHCFTHLFVQTAESKELLEKIGHVRSVSISGDPRFDRVIEIAEKMESIPFIEEFCGNHKVIVAGSTWREDEEELDHYANTHPDIRFIIAPHEIDEEHVQYIKRLFKYNICYSQIQSIISRLPSDRDSSKSSGASNSGINTLIIDNIGMLSRLYRYATITYVGGGFGDDGVHNVLEPAVYGKPVLFGPVFDKYIEAIELIEYGAAFSIETALELEDKFNTLLANEQLLQECVKAAKHYVFSKKGATTNILRYVQENRLLTNW